jgi:uncharacterized protein (DUF2132 family)
MDHCWNVAFYGAETWALQKEDQKYLESFEMTRWRRMEEISWANRVGNEVLHTVKGERNIVHTIKRRKGTNTSLKEEGKDRNDGKAKMMMEGAAG